MARFRKQTRYKVWYVDHEGRLRMEKLYAPPLSQNLLNRRKRDDMYVIRRVSGEWEALEFFSPAGTVPIFRDKNRQTVTAWAAMRAALTQGRSET